MKIEYILILPIIVWGLVNLTVVISVRLLSKPYELLEDVNKIDSKQFLSTIPEFSNWCRENNFVHEKDFLFHGILTGPPIECSAWWSSTEKTWALLYVAPTAKNIDFVSTFAQGFALSTASSRDSLMLPSPPNSYIQAFTNMGNEERYALHQEALERIERSLGSINLDDRSELFHKIAESILDQVSYIRKKPLWHLRGAYWYFVSRNLDANKAVSV